MIVLVVLMTALVMSVLLIWWFDVTTLHCISCIALLNCLVSCIDFSGLMHARTLYQLYEDVKCIFEFYDDEKREKRKRKKK